MIRAAFLFSTGVLTGAYLRETDRIPSVYPYLNPIEKKISKYMDKILGK